MGSALRWVVASLAMFVAATSWLPASVEEDEEECRARVTSELLRKEEQETSTQFTWGVHVTTEEACAVVEFRLILTIQKPDSEDETVVRLGRVRVSDGAIDHQMRYEMSANYVLADWEIVESACELCVVDEPDGFGR